MARVSKVTMAVVAALLAGLAAMMPGDAHLGAEDQPTEGVAKDPSHADQPSKEDTAKHVFGEMLGRFDAEFEQPGPDGTLGPAFTGKVKREAIREGLIQETVTLLDEHGERQTIDTTWSVMPGRIAFSTTSSYGPDMMHGSGTISADGKRLEVECLMNGEVYHLVSEFLVGEEVDEKGETYTWPYERHSMYTMAKSSSEGEAPERVLTSRVVFTPSDLTNPEAAAAFGYMLPSEAHKRLVDMEGEWTTKVTVNLAGLLVFEGTGTASASLVMGKRFIEERHDFTLPMGPVELKMTIGHNNGTGKFEVVRAMSLASGIDTMSGRHNPANGDIECEGRAWEPRIGDFVLQRAKFSSAVDGKRKLTLELNYGREWIPAVTVDYVKVVPKAEEAEPAKEPAPEEGAK